jgi:hypothetical protein
MEIAENISVEKVRAENDEAWNRVLNIYFKDFVEFFWPQAYQAIDWSKYYEPLEQELLAVDPKGKIGKRYIDKLFKVFFKNGKEQ